jgi:hypothetical protein
MHRRGFILGAGGTALLAGSLRSGAALAAASTDDDTGSGGVLFPGSAQDAILDLFDQYELVGGWSPGHGVRNTDDFLIGLLGNPRLPYTVQDIAVEGGNSLYQPILDQYTAGQDVPFAEVQQVWLNTTQPNVGFSTFYQELYPLVRRINARLPPERRMRVVACDSPVDWSTVTTLQDLQPFMDRDAYIAAAIEQQILARNRKALLLFGVAHVQHDGGAAGIYEHDYPGAGFVIADHRGFAADNDALEQRMAGWPVPSLARMAGTWLGELDSSYYSEPAGQSGYPGVDGYLYEGPRDFLMHQPISAWTALNADYIAELQRRNDITQGPGSPQAIEQEEESSSALFYDPDPTS